MWQRGDGLCENINVCTSMISHRQILGIAGGYYLRVKYACRSFLAVRTEARYTYTLYIAFKHATSFKKNGMTQNSKCEMARIMDQTAEIGTRKNRNDNEENMACMKIEQIIVLFFFGGEDVCRLLFLFVKQYILYSSTCFIFISVNYNIYFCVIYIQLNISILYTYSYIYIRIVFTNFV